MQKGISPLVAAVLLIAVTMTIAGVLAYWASTFVRGQTDAFENQTITTECNFGNFLIDACSYDSTSQRMTLILDNIGTVDLNNISAFVIYSDNTLNATQTGQSITSGELKSVSIDGVTPGYSTVRIRTHCPNVFEETRC